MLAYCKKLNSFLGEQDQAESYYNEEIKESYHSKIGPIVEARHKFIEPCLENVKSSLQSNKKIRILDLFFGLGYNTGTFIDSSYNISNSPILEITAIENDIEIINKIESLQVPEWYRKWRDLLSTLCRDMPWHVSTQAKYENIKIHLINDSIFNVIDKLQEEHFDIIFFDPFSHKSTPEFWTNDFLIKVFKLLAKNGSLTTYSGLKRVEQLAIELNYCAKKINPIGRKKNSLHIMYN